MKLLFWFSVIGVTYSYLLYPIILLAMRKRNKELTKDIGAYPNVSLIITAHNEASRIQEKLANALEVDYPGTKLEIIVASDASGDGTDELVRGFADRGIRLVRADVRKGKEYAQSLAIREAKGEILVFSDVATRLLPDSIEKMARNFADPRVGAVSSEDRFIGSEGKFVGEGAYVTYEMWLRKLESRVNSLVGLSGSFFAVRREVCQEWDISVPSDFNAALNCVRQGYVAVTDPEVLGYYQDVKDEKREYQRKLRTVIRGLSAIFRRPDVLNPFAFGLFAFQVWSHKIMRWFVPWFLILLFVSSSALMGEHWFYLIAFIVQVLFYLAVLFGLLFVKLRNMAIFRLPFYFVQVNAAIAQATIAFLCGKRVTVWQPSKR